MEPAPRRIPEVLCLCDLSLLENPNIQTRLLQQPGPGRDGSPQSARIPVSVPGGFLGLNLVGFNQSTAKGGRCRFGGISGCRSSSSP